MKIISLIRGSSPDWKRGFGILLLRIFVGLRLLYGVVDNVLSWEKMLEFSFFLESFGFLFPIVCAVVCVYVQFFAGIFILMGYKVRFFSLLMVFNFLIALLFVHLPARDNIEAMTPALALMFICLNFIFTGAEKFSLDHLFAKKENAQTKPSVEIPLPGISTE